MIRLQTFGGAVLFTHGGAPLVGAAAQRRTLGLLSVLAVAGETGLSRDKLVGILWPEGDAQRARHSLTQALYAARKSVECADLFEVAEDIRLNPVRIRTDVGDLEGALRAGDDATVAALYRGPFLDGFFFSSAEFENWLIRQRLRLENAAVGALERLAEQADIARDTRSATEWLRRLAAIRPSDTGIAVRLIRSIAEQGDRAGAIQQAQHHIRILHDEFDLEPDGVIVQMMQELRSPRAPVPAPALPEPVALPIPPDVVTVTRARPEPAGANWPAHVEPAWPGAPEGGTSLVRRTRNRRILATLLPLAVLLFGAYLAGRLDLRSNNLAPLNQSVVVAPFRVLGADASMEYLREGLVELLSTRLADDTAARSVDAGAVIRAWRRAGITGATDASRDTVVRMAARLGAKRVIMGSVVGTPARAIMRATIVGASSGQVSDEVTVEGPTDSLSSLVDELAGKLLVSQAGHEERLTRSATPSLPALRSYLAGFGPYADGDYAVAVDRFSRALRADTTFALAALRLALAADRLNDFELQRRALDQAWRLREDLSERDRAHLTALIGAQYPAATNRADAIAAWENATQLAGNRAEVWFGFASAIAGNTDEPVQGNDREKVRAALARTLELDPNHSGAQILLESLPAVVPAPLRRDSAEAVETGADSAAPAQPAEASSPFRRWRAAAQQLDTATMLRLADSLIYFGPANLRAIALASQVEGVRLQDGASALRSLTARAANSEQALDLLLAEHSLALNLGRLTVAFEATRKLQRLSPATRAHLRLRVLDAVFSEGDRGAATQAAAELELALRNPRLTSASADLCALAQWQYARGDTASARASVQRLRPIPGYDPLAVSAPPSICADLVEAALAVSTGRDDAVRQVERVDSLLLSVAAVGDVATYGHIALARLYAALDRPEQALAAVRRRPFMSAAWPRYLATAWREEGELAQQLGDVEGALRAFRQYLALRSNPEPKLVLEQQAVRAAVSELSAGGR